MIEAGVPDSERPYNTYFEDQRDFPFNGEPIVVYHETAGDDTASVVMFRRSDVIAAGDVFSTESYPAIDLERGGSVVRAIAALNHMLDLAVPSKMLQEGGTYVIPGHGRISDEHDVVMYRDMLQIVSDRVRAMVEQGMTLSQVQAARPTIDYDPRYGSTTGEWTTAMFVEAMYREFKGPEASTSGAAP
jgi:glyoxylase-like metal-dependent hydrolase (beta-lactamase superfamily II)